MTENEKSNDILESRPLLELKDDSIDENSNLKPKLVIKANVPKRFDLRNFFEEVNFRFHHYCATLCA